MIWKNYDYGVFGFPKSRVIVQDTVVADSYIGNEVHIFSDNFFFLHPYYSYLHFPLKIKKQN